MTYDDIDAQELAIAQAQARIKALRGAAAQVPQAQEVPGWQSAVTGTRVGPQIVAPSKWGALLPALAGAAAGIEANVTLPRMQKKLNEDQNAAFDELIAQRPQGTPATPESYGAGEQGPEYTPAKAAALPTRQQNIEWAAKLSRLPKARKLGEAVLTDQIVAAPTRDAAQSLELQKFMLGRQDKQAELAETKRYHDIQAGKPISLGQGNYLLPDGQGGWTREGPGVKVSGSIHQMGDRMIWTSSDGQQQRDVGPAPAVKPNATMVKGIAENNAQMAKIDRALNQLATPEGKSGFGWWQGSLNAVPGAGNKLLDWFNPQGTATRALVTDIGSSVLHDRSGATVTAAEFPRLQPFIPQVGDPPDVVATKLNNLRDNYRAINEELSAGATLESMGVRPRASAATAPAKPTAPGRSVRGTVGGPAPASSGGWTIEEVT